MVLRTAGANWLTLMMRAERARRGFDLLGSQWLLYGPTDPDAVDVDVPGQGEALDLLAAE